MVGCWSPPPLQIPVSDSEEEGGDGDGDDDDVSVASDDPDLLQLMQEGGPRTGGAPSGPGPTAAPATKAVTQAPTVAPHAHVQAAIHALAAPVSGAWRLPLSCHISPVLRSHSISLTCPEAQDRVGEGEGMEGLG